MKKLYILVQDCGDGSYSLCYTMDSDMIGRMQDAYDNDEIDHESAPGIDGDGFNYRTLNIPDECTYASLGISEYIWSPIIYGSP